MEPQGPILEPRGIILEASATILKFQGGILETENEVLKSPATQFSKPFPNGLPKVGVGPVSFASGSKFRYRSDAD